MFWTDTDTDTDDLFAWVIAPHEGVRVDDLPPRNTYNDYAYEQENQQTKSTMTVCLNYELDMLRNLKDLC